MPPPVRCKRCWAETHLPRTRTPAIDAPAFCLRANSADADRTRPASAAAGKAATHGQTPDTRFPLRLPANYVGNTHLRARPARPPSKPDARASETPQSGHAHARNPPRRADRASAGKRLRASHARARQTPKASRGRGRQAKRASPCTRSPETGTAGKPARGQDPRTTSRDFKVREKSDDRLPNYGLYGKLPHN
jgi:hypothetical protein